MVEELIVTPALKIPFSELRFSFDRSGGPGGQNVNKLNTRAQLRFDVRGSRALDESQRERLLEKLGKRLNQDGVLIVRSDRFRTQRRNREDCLEKLAALLGQALQPPPPKRRPSRPGRAALIRRREHKRRHSKKKKLRRPPTE